MGNHSLQSQLADIAGISEEQLQALPISKDALQNIFHKVARTDQWDVLSHTAGASIIASGAGLLSEPHLAPFLIPVIALSLATLGYSIYKRNETLNDIKEDMKAFIPKSL